MRKSVNQLLYPIIFLSLGGAKKGKQQQQQPVSYSPPLSPNYPGNAPVLPPRPSKPGHQDPTPPPNYPAPSQPPKTRYSQPPPPHLHSQPPLPSQPNLPARNIPPPSILSRPPIQHIGGYPPQGDMGGGYDEEAEDIYGTYVHVYKCVVATRNSISDDT